MEFKELVLKTRSYRRFDGTVSIDEETLSQLVDLARCTPSGGNRQPLKYVTSCSAEWNVKIFQTLSWAGSLPDWPGPVESERPTGYIVILTDTKIRDTADSDIGIAAQTILLGAVARGLGGCMFGSIKRTELAGMLQLPEHLKISLIVALGKPVEAVVLEQADPGDSLAYYRDADQKHHVPKRKLDEILLKSLV